MKKLLMFLLVFLGYSAAFCQDSLHFTFPTANAKFIAGSDTLITWEGIAPTDSVRLEYSSDNGKTWLMFSQKAIGLNYLWKNIPNKVGNGYLMRLIHIGERVNKLDAPYIEWSKTYGGSDYEGLCDIKELKKGGYVAVGSCNSVDGDLDTNRGKQDIWVLKLDSKGNKIFSKTYGGNSEEMVTFVLETKDLGFLVGGRTFSKDFGAVSKPIFGDLNTTTCKFLLKLDEDGNIEWRKNYGNSAAWPFNDADETADGGYILASDTIINNKDQVFYILKVDRKGNYEWSKSFKNVPPNIAHSILTTKDNGYIVSGQIHNSNNIDELWILKLDKNGVIQWEKTIKDNYSASYSNIIQLHNGNYQLFYSTGLSYPYEIKYNIMTVQIDGTGKTLWTRIYGGTGSDGFGLSNMANNTIIEDGIVFCCTTNSADGDITYNHGGSDGWFVKIDYEGDIKFQRTFGGSNYDNFYSTQQTSDSGYIICGQTNSSDGDITENKGGMYDGWIIKLTTKYQLMDTVTTTFSIVAPQPAAIDVDMGKVYVGEWRDSTVAEFVYNIGSYKFRVDSIYFRDADKSAFSLIGGFPKYNVEPDSGKPAKFKFTPTREGMHYANIVIVTQTDTLIQNIWGEGLKKRTLISVEFEPFTNLICDNSTSTTVEIKSTGGETLIIKELNLSGADKSDFSINETLPINIAPDSTKTITIGFKSNISGIKTAALEIKSTADPDSVITIPLNARKDSIALVPSPTLIDLGTLFPNQTKDTSFIISNLGTIQTDGKVTFTNNISCSNPTFTLDSGGVYKLDFTFKGISADGNINEKITVWDDVCKYFRDVLITGKVVSPHLLGFSATQCISYEKEYKLTLQNPSSSRLKITSIEIEQNPQLFEIEPSLVFPLFIEPYTNNYKVKLKYKDDIAQKFTTAVKCFTDNKFIPLLTDTIYAETVDYTRTTSGLINDTIRTVSNPFAVSYDSESENGKNKFTYAIQVNEIANDMDYLTGVSDLEVIINYNTNVLGVDFDSQSKNVKVRLGDELQGNYSIKSIKEIKIDKYSSEIIINLENIGKQIITKNAYKLLELDFSAYLSNYNLTNEQNTEKSRKASISHSITTPDICISYETADNAYLDIEKLCVDEFRSIKIPNNPDERFYLSDVIPQPVGSTDATIEYGLGFECAVTIKIYDISGAVVLAPINEIQKAGTHKLAISSKSLSAGAYFIEMKSGPFKETKKIMVE